MEKNSMLTLFFFLALTTFVQSQDKAHTPSSIDHQYFRAFDSRFMEKLITENPSLLHRWNHEPGLNWPCTLLPFEPKIVFLSNQANNFDCFDIFMNERERNFKFKTDPRNLNDIEGRTFTGLLFSPLLKLAENLNQ